MAAPSANQRSSLASSEMSLLRSLSAIPRPYSTAARRTSPKGVAASPSAQRRQQLLPAPPFRRQMSADRNVDAAAHQMRMVQSGNDLLAVATTRPAVRKREQSRRRASEIDIGRMRVQQSRRRASEIDGRRASVSLSPSAVKLSQAAAVEGSGGKMPAPVSSSAQEPPFDGFRKDYKLGETLRSPSHMIVESTPQIATRAVGTLKKHDFAFVKRSDGSYSYAIVAYRSMEPIKGSSRHDASKDPPVEEECMAFIINDTGSTKTIRRRHWSDLVRRASKVEPRPTAADDDATKTWSMLCQEIKKGCSKDEGNRIMTVDEKLEKEKQLALPSSIAFVPGQASVCSLISSVSDRARASARPKVWKPR